jgi:hypothetical protein
MGKLVPTSLFPAIDIAVGTGSRRPGSNMFQ